MKSREPAAEVARGLVDRERYPIDDLESDAGESADLAQARPALLEELLEAHAGWESQTVAPAWITDNPDSRIVRELSPAE